MLKVLREAIGEVLGEEAFEIGMSESASRGHVSTNAAFILAEKEKIPPMEAAEKLRSYLHKQLPTEFLERIEIAEPGFINIWLATETIQRELKKIVKAGATLGKGSKKKDSVIVEYSSPNIAKPLHVGHMRSTLIGDALANLFEFAGYKVVRWNYLGDWGTQFGKVIAAYKLWGNKEKIRKHPVEELANLYIKFHRELDGNPELADRSREEFKKLETGDKGNIKLWKWFKKISLKELSRAYNVLGVRFSVFIGEAFYKKQLKPTINSLVEKGVARESEGALIVPLDKFGLPPALVRKSDGATLYFTRDIANLQYRLSEYHPKKILYVIGNEQSLHLAQIFATAQLLKIGEGVELTHVKHGLIMGKDGKPFSTREGGVIELQELIKKSIDLAGKIMKERQTDLKKGEMKEVSRAIGIGALKYGDLSQSRLSDIVFDWDKALSFEGNSAPYLQYTYARLRSILRKIKKVPKLEVSSLKLPEDLSLVIKLAEFPEALQRALSRYAPHHLATYLYELAKEINSYYQNEPVLSSEPGLRNLRLNIVKMSASVLKNGLGLLGIEAVERM